MEAVPFLLLIIIFVNRPMLIGANVHELPGMCALSPETRFSLPRGDRVVGTVLRNEACAPTTTHYIEIDSRRHRCPKPDDLYVRATVILQVCFPQR